MNLNEECLLQYLQRGPSIPATGEEPSELPSLQTEMKRVLRRNHYVSFPAAILVRRPDQQ